MPNPTIVLASLDDEKLKQSIANLVAHVKRATHTMLTDTNSTVGEMEAKLKSLGKLKIDTGGSNDGGASKRTKAQNAETEAIEKNVAARDKQIKKNQEAAMSFDNFSKAQQVAIRSANPSGIRNAEELQTMNIQLDLLRERLREARQQYSSFVALTAHATTTGDKGLFQYATEGVHRYEQEVRSLIPQIRTLQSGIQQMGDVIAPQGHTIQNYVNSLQKANPELAQLNEQFKRGQSLLQQGKTAVNSVSNAFENGTNQSKKTLDELNASVAQSIRREQERRDAIRQTGLAAQDAFAKIRQNVQIQLAENTDKPIKGVKELTNAITDMRRLYFDMSTAEKESPLGLALKRDIENAQKLKIAIDANNRTLMGLPVLSTKNDANKSLGAYTELTNILKTLTDEYKRLGREERNAAKGNDLADKIQRLSRETQKIQQQMNRPISFTAAMKGDEKTLDDIAYKMQRLRAYKQGIDLTKPNAANEIKQVDEALARLQKDADKWISKSQEMIKNNTALGRSWNYMKNRLAFYFTVGASTQFIKNLVDVRSQYEMNEKALGILIDSAERGTQIFNELSQMALVSPYTLIELSTAAKQLTAYDVAAKDVVDTTRRLADMAAAVGIPIERLTYALGQIKAYGYLNSRDARMFANAGIPLVKQLSDYYTELEGRLVSTADVYDRIKKKAIDYNEVMEVINKMTDQGGKFFDFQAKMADTLKVQLANLTLAWNNMLNEIGKSNQGILTFGIGALKELFLQWRKFSSAIYSAAWAGGLVIAIRALNVLLVKAGFNFRILSKDMTAAGIAGQGLATKMRTLGSSIASVAKSSITWWTLLAFAVVDAAKDLYYINEAQENLNKSIRDGAKDNYDNISKFLEQYKVVRDSLYSTRKVAIGSIYNPTTRKAEATAYAEQQVGQDIDKNEAKKAWEAIREQIELTSQSSDVYISKLLTIENMSERVRQGFNVLDDIQVVNAALKEIDDDTIKMSASLSAWWNLWSLPDGLIDNLQDYKNAIDDTENSWKKAGKTIASLLNPAALYTGGTNIIENYIKDSDDKLKDFREDLKVTTDSILNFIELKGWSGDEGKINQVFEQLSKKLVLDNQLDPNSAFIMQTEIEEARSKAAKEALEKRIADEKAALAIAETEEEQTALKASIGQNEVELVNFEKYNGRKKVEWERFTKWLKEQHISETTAMFRNMDAEDIKSLNFQEGKHAEWVTRMVTQYAKEHKMSYDEAFGYLKHWVSNANQWSIFLPLIISTEDKKSVYDQLGEYDKAIDDADSQIARLTRRIGELREKRKLDKKELQELVHAQQELTDAEKAKADAEAKGGHGKKEAKDEKAARKAAGKAAKQAESELQKVLKDELSTIEKVRSIYKDLTKEGMSHANAVERATRGWDETVNAINRVLQKNGLQKLDLSKFVGVENPRELVNMLQSQLNTLIKRGAKPAEIKELQAKIQTLNVDADKYDLTRITKGLNNELGKLKDEYELAVELDANPELGGIFADMMGLDKEQLAQMPRDFNGVVVRMQKIIDDKLGAGKFNLVGNLNKAMFESWLKANQQGTPEDDAIAKSLESIIDYVNKIRLDSSKKQIDEWNKLLEKYAEYEYKRTQIQKEAEREREVARKKGASQEIVDAINERERQELARISFEEFQKSPEWIVATGDLANMSKSAIGMLIAELERYKKSAKNLSPKQIKQLNSALSKLYKEQRKNNPFKAISNMLDEAKERMSAFDEDIKNTQEEIDNLTKKKKESIVEGIVDKETDGKLRVAIERLKNLKKKQEEVGEVDASSWVSSINETIGAVKAAIGVFDDLAKAIGGVNNSDLDKAFSVIDKAGQGAAIGAQIGGGYGAIIGAVAGAASELISIFAGAENERINKKIKDSERAVKRLENAYKNLEYAIDNAYGANVIGAKQAAIANKELQLVELERQLRLEKSRSSKHRDEERIETLKGEIIDLRNEIKTSYQEVATSLLGISSVGDAALEFMDAYISALRKGEDAQAAFTGSYKEMIASMIKQLWVTKVIGPQLESIVDELNNRLKNRSMAEAKAYEEASRKYEEMSNMSDEELVNQYFESQGGGYFQTMFQNAAMVASGNLSSFAESLRKQAETEMNDAKKELVKATTPTIGDMDLVAQGLDDIQPVIEAYNSQLDELLKRYNLYDTGDKESNLSALQQGIQGITEDTAGALEAYMNGVSQQVYYHSSLLEQIRDSVVGLDLDVSLGVQSQMLLQLQNSYQTQQAIQQILEGVLVPSGRAFAVELLS